MPAYLETLLGILTWIGIAVLGGLILFVVFLVISAWMYYGPGGEGN